MAVNQRRLFRAMRSDEGKPAVGIERNMLGVRPGIDVKGATAGPGRGGMSVTADDPKRMNPGVLPKPFGGLNAETVVFETVEGTFDVPSRLLLGAVDAKRLHAVIESRFECTLDAMQALLAKTRDYWAATALPQKEAP